MQQWWFFLDGSEFVGYSYCYNSCWRMSHTPILERKGWAPCATAAVYLCLFLCTKTWDNWCILQHVMTGRSSHGALPSMSTGFSDFWLASFRSPFKLRIFSVSSDTVASGLIISSGWLLWNLLTALARAVFSRSSWTMRSFNRLQAKIIKRKKYKYMRSWFSLVLYLFGSTGWIIPRELRWV